MDNRKEKIERKLNVYCRSFFWVGEVVEILIEGAVCHLIENSL